MPAKPKKEIKRVWVIPARSIPAEVLDESVTCNSLDRGTVVDRANGGELLVQRKDGNYFITMKNGSKRDPEEWEKEIPRWAFNLLWASTEGRRFEKVQYSCVLNGYTVTISIYDLATPEFTPALIECKFPTLGKAAGFILPDWAHGAVDVTDDPRFEEKNLAEDPEAAREAL